MLASALDSFTHYLLQGSAYVAAAAAVGGAAWAAVRFVDRTLGRRRALGRLVEQLTNAVRIEYITGVLGPSKFRRSQDDLIEDVFVTEYCYVQTLSVPDGTVQRLAVTTTDSRFRPEFWLGLPGSWPSARFRLGETRFGDVDLTATWRVSRGARRFQYWEKYYLGNPGGYRTYVLAISDAGIGTTGDLRLILPGIAGGNGGNSTDEAFPADDGESLVTQADWQEFRRTSLIDTFVISADDDLATEGWLGADYDLVRLLPPSRWQRKRIERNAIREIRRHTPNHPMVKQSSATNRRTRRR